MYPNLNAELARRNITSHQLSAITGINYNTLRMKLRGATVITLPEAKKIRSAIDSSLSLDVLFEERQ